MPSQDLKNISEVINVLRFQLTLDHHVVYIYFNILAQLWFKHPSHHPLISRPCIFKYKRSDESYFFLIFQGQRYLVVALKGVQKAHSRMTYSDIY